MLAEHELIAHRYRLDSCIGRGGMGEVWRAHDLQLGRAVAVKVLLPKISTSPDAVARFEREARVGAALAHPNVVHTLDFGCDGERWYLVMQLVPGEDLYAHRRAHHPIGGSTVIAYGYQIADALAAAHAIGLVHRDLKPENILLEQTAGEMILRVADFGMAYVVAPTDPKQGRLTVDGLTGGTPLYMAPEQASSDGAGPPADIYALGCVLYELATGLTPYDGPPAKVLAAHLYAPIPSLAALRPDLPPGLDELVQRMLAKAPAARPTADAVRRRLAVLDGGELDPRARARDGGMVSDRATRMLTRRDEVVTAQLPTLITRIGVLGTMDQELAIALAAGGLTIVEAADETVEARVVVGGSLEMVAHACLGGMPVIADARVDDFRRIAALLRLGVAEVVIAPIVPSELVRKLARALRKRPERVP